MEIKGITSRDIWKAKKRISSYITRTPLVYSPALSEATGANIYLKLENLQAIGAFKVRGAANKILSLTEEERSKGVSTFSTGNHGMAVAYIANRVGAKALVCMSNHVPANKVKAISRWKPEIKQNWDSQSAAGVYCYELEEKEGIKVIPPFDDKEIICGQGTMSLEIVEDLPEIDTAIVPLSGGGPPAQDARPARTKAKKVPESRPSSSHNPPGRASRRASPRARRPCNSSEKEI